jgi:hypothetical protein
VSIYIKTSIILFDNCKSDCNKINLDDEINKNELFVMFNTKYYVYDDIHAEDFEFIKKVEDEKNGTFFSQIECAKE